MSYNYLLDLKFSPQEAAQLAASFHGDYASVPPATRKKMNKFLFTPTFEAVMNKVYFKMIKEGIKTVTGKIQTPSDKRYAKGLLYLGGIIFGMDQFMTRGLGFKREEFGRRYYKEVETDEGMRETVIVLSNPANLWNRLFYDLKPDAFQTNMLKKVVKAGYKRLNPVYRIGNMLANNEDEVKAPIYNPFDSAPRQLLDIGKFALTRIVKATENIGDLKGDAYNKKQATKALATAVGNIRAKVLSAFVFSYTRKPGLVRFNAQMKNFEREFTKHTNIDIEKAMQSNDIDGFIDDYEKQVTKYMRILEKEVGKELDNM